VIDIDRYDVIPRAPLLILLYRRPPARLHARRRCPATKERSCTQVRGRSSQPMHHRSSASASKTRSASNGAWQGTTTDKTGARKRSRCGSGAVLGSRRLRLRRRGQLPPPLQSCLGHDPAASRLPCSHRRCRRRGTLCGLLRVHDSLREAYAVALIVAPEPRTRRPRPRLWWLVRSVARVPRRPRRLGTHGVRH
jgi:hypothetical protein